MANPPIVFKSPLPPADLLFDAMSYTAGLSTLDEMRLNLLSPKSSILAEDLLGKPVDVRLTLRDGKVRAINGYVTRFGFGRHQGRHFGYEAMVRPWLWFLTRTSDCRIFQAASVPDIVKSVFADHKGIAKFEFFLSGSYRTRDYCVQYRETDFNFIARLLEDEGIYWFFEHTEGEHKLILTDHPETFKPATGDALPFFANAGQVPPDQEYIGSWNFARNVESGAAVLASYNFEQPSSRLLTEVKSIDRGHDLDDLEQFDYQGDYLSREVGASMVATRLEEIQSRHESLSGTTNSHVMAVGHQFELTRHPRDDQNGKYVCTQAQITAHANSFESGGDAGDVQCSFSAMAASSAFRPQRRTPKPFVQGPQTAVVVGKAGDEIYTDKYGRVKVQFHWDRLGKKDEKSSCWVRVSSPWAGKSFGFIQVPRIGQEVVVDFLEGDPDQPLITGRVYNADNMPPWELPANATQSGVLTRSSKGGAYGNANALRFEDKKGSEQLWLHAEKNQDIEVENDETHWVGHDRRKTIDHDETVHVKHDRTETVDNNETITIGVDRTELVGRNESITIGANRSVSVGANETKTVALQRTHSVGVNETIAIGAAQEIAIGAAQSVSIGANQTVSIGANQSTSVGTNLSTTVGANSTSQIGGHLDTAVSKDEKRNVGGARETNVGKDDKWQVGNKFFLEAGDEITLKTGDASITMKKDGTIQIKGKDITISGSGKIGVKASGDMVLKGSKIAQN